MDTSPTPRWRFARAVHTGLGLLLLAAAGLKLYGMNVAPFAQYGWFTAPWVQVLAVFWEILLGLWLLSGAYRAGAWVAAVGTFAAFAAVSGYLGWIGQASCGCFGVIRASPWWALGLDLVALLALWLGRPPLVVAGSFSFRELKTLGVGTACVAGLGTLSVLAFGSLDGALARLRGESLSVSTSYLDFGEGSPNEILTATVEITNRSDGPVQLVGGTSDCSCIATDDMPVTIQPGESAGVRVLLKVPASGAGLMSRWVELRTNDPNHPRIRLRAGCLVRS
jgi:hypothetical protein